MELGMPKQRAPEKVVITGISGRFGRLLARELHRQFPVIGIDRRPFREAPRDVEMHRVDIRSRSCEDIFRTNNVGAVVHLNIMHNPRKSGGERHQFNLVGTRQLLQYCEQYRVQKVIVLSTANLYGASPRTQQYVGEDAPLLGGGTDANSRHLIELDMLVTSFLWQYPQVETVVLRPVHILGSVHNAPSNYLRLPRIPKLMGFDPLVQVIHELDVVRAIQATLMPGARGIFNVTGPEAVPLSAMLAQTNKPVINVPHVLFEMMARRLYKSRVWNFPAAELDHLKYGCMVSANRVSDELGFKPQYSLEDTLAPFRPTRDRR
jgi:UDP-glucose 4-epimerase